MPCPPGLKQVPDSIEDKIDFLKFKSSMVVSPDTAELLTFFLQKKNRMTLTERKKHFTKLNNIIPLPPGCTSSQLYVAFLQNQGIVPPVVPATLTDVRTLPKPIPPVPPKPKPKPKVRTTPRVWGYLPPTGLKKKITIDYFRKPT